MTEMPAPSERLIHKQITQKIIGVFYDVYNELGHGFLESVYHEAMSIVLLQLGLRVERNVALPVWFRGGKIGTYFADLIVENVVILELKAASGLDPAHEAQLLHYLRSTANRSGVAVEFRTKTAVQTASLRECAKGNPRRSAKIRGKCRLRGWRSDRRWPKGCEGAEEQTGSRSVASWVPVLF